jgi:NTE family protein
VVTATNLEGKRVFHEGDLVEAIMASSYVPVLFEAVMINKIPYIDGGVMNNMPVEPIEQQCKKLIGVYINPTGKITELKGLVHIAERSFHLAIASEINTKHARFDIYIEPEEITTYSFFDLKKAPELLARYRKTVEILKNRQVQGDM